MPWEETCAVDQREQFIALWLTGGFTKSDLCSRFGISRPTGDKWLKRHAEYGVAGLADRSRAPLSHPNATTVAVCEQIIALKRERPHWGPKKILDLLRRKYPAQHWPADSTGGDSWPARGWSVPVGRGVGCRLTHRRLQTVNTRIRCGAWISKGTSGWAMVSAAIR